MVRLAVLLLMQMLATQKQSSMLVQASKVVGVVYWVVGGHLGLVCGKQALLRQLQAVHVRS
jgi:hypothetical protein